MPVFCIPDIPPPTKPFIINTDSPIEITITNNLPESIEIQYISMTLTTPLSEISSPLEEDSKAKSRSRHSSTSSGNGGDMEGGILCNASTVPLILDLQPHFEVKGDKTIISTGMICRTVLKRMDSGPQFLRERDLKKEESKLHADVRDVTLHPGDNKVVLNVTVSCTVFMKYLEIPKVSLLLECNHVYLTFK